MKIENLHARICLSVGLGVILIALPVRGDDLFTEIYDGTSGFGSYSYSETPSGGLVQGIDGYLYGTTTEPIHGTVYSVSTNGAFSSLAQFGVYDGYNPVAGLIQGIDSNFYGTTTGGGQFFGGTIFRVTPAGTLTTLYSFTGGSDGAGGCKLVQGSDGTLYGKSYGGGASGNGTVFAITPQGSFRTLHSFTGGNDGANPGSELTYGTDGNLYGTTEYGGANNNGSVFRITTGGILNTLHSFTGGGDGAIPVGGLVQGTDGSFYGTTYYRGAYSNLDPDGNGYGTVFKITTSGSLTTLASFNNTNGANPNTTLVQGSDGNFYGTTYGGLTDYGFIPGIIQNFGTVFRMTPSGTISTLISFDYMDGYGGILNAVIEGRDGNLYGTSQYGQGGGNVFRLNINSVSQPTNSNSTLPLTITKMQAKVNFAKIAADTCALGATLPLRATFNPLGQTVVLDIGGAQANFTLDAKGHRTGLQGTCKLMYSKSKSTWILTVVLKNGLWRYDWSNDSMVNATVSNARIIMPVTVTVGTNTFTADRSMLYKAKAGKSGMAK